MGVERDRRPALPEGLARDQVGRADHAVGLDQRVGNLVPLDDEAEPFEELCHRLGRWVAVARRIVGRDLDDLGKEAGLGLLMGAEVFADGGFGGHGAFSVRLGYLGLRQRTLTRPLRGVPSPWWERDAPLRPSGEDPGVARAPDEGLARFPQIIASALKALGRRNPRSASRHRPERCAPAAGCAAFRNRDRRACWSGSRASAASPRSRRAPRRG